MGTDINLVKIEYQGLAEPVSKLVEAMTGALGGLYLPHGIVRKAKGEAKAKIINAEAKAKAKEIELRATQRREYMEIKHQQNLEMIFGKALQELPNEVSVLPTSEEWLLQFVEAARNVSDEEMHTIWAKILAGEVSHPGTYSKRTLEFIKLLEKQDAETFSTICQYAFEMGNQQGFRFVFSPNTIEQSYHGQVTEQDLGHLNSIGLLRQAEYLPIKIIIEGSILYFHRKLEFEEVPEAPFERMRNESVLIHPLSMLGQELFELTNAQAVEGFLENSLPLIEESLHIKPVLGTITPQDKT